MKICPEGKFSVSSVFFFQNGRKNALMQHTSFKALNLMKNLKSLTFLPEIFTIKAFLTALTHEKTWQALFL